MPLVLCLLSVQFVWGESPRQDSLRKAATQYQGDSLGFDAMSLLSRSYWGENLDSAHVIALRSSSMATPLGNDLYTYEAEANVGIALLFQGRYREALPHFYTSQESAERYGDLKKIAAATNNVAITHQELGNYSKGVRKQRGVTST